MFFWAFELDGVVVFYEVFFWEYFLMVQLYYYVVYLNLVMFDYIKYEYWLVIVILVKNVYIWVNVCFDECVFYFVVEYFVVIIK